MRSSRLLSLLLSVGLLSASFVPAVQAQSTITIGDTNVETDADNGNGNLILAQKAALAQSATVVSLSFYVTQPSGSLILGLYDATGSGGHPGKLLAVTSSFTPVNGWNTANVVTPASLAAGNYWLAYLPSSDNLSFVKQNNSGSCVLHGQTFTNGMPATFATSTTNCSATTWSFYATLTASGGGTVVDGVCGSSNGATLTSAPTANLCSAGTASAVTGTGPWNWTCIGSGGGTTASCSAQLQGGSPVAPTITSQPQSQSVTAGATATFTVVASGTAPLSYQWSKNGAAIGGATSASYTTPATLSSDNGATFTVQVSNSAGSQTSNAATLTVNSPPTITTQPQNQTVTLGSAATFGVQATGTAPLSYQWSKNGTLISGATSASYTTPATVSTDNGSTFTVRVSNVAGSQTSNAATLTVNTPPTITTQPQSQTVTVGATATFSVVATGTAPLGYQWSKNGTLISGATSASYTTPATVSGDNGATFSVQVSNSVGSQTSNAATLTVSASSPSTITIGDTNLESDVDGDNANLVLAQEAALSQSATIVSLSFYVTQASGSLILGLYDATGSGGHPGKLLAVTGSFAPVSGWNTANVVTPASLAAGNYWLAYLPSSGDLSFVKQNGSGSCVYQGQTFSNGMPAAFATSTTNCSPTTWSFYATLTTSGGGGSPVAPTITTQPQNQSVTAGATATFTVVASGTAPLSYQWSKNGAAIAGATGASYTTPATVSGDNGSTFSVQVSNSAGSQTSNAATLTVNSPPTITTQPHNQTVTLGSTATFSVAATGTAPLSYRWSKNGRAISGATSSSYTTPATVSSDNGSTFTVRVTNVAGSQTSSAATLTVTSGTVAPSITTQPQSQTVTVGATATFSVVATGTAPLSYQWSKNGTAINGATSSSYTTPVTVSSDNGSTFTVKVSNSAGSQTSTAATLTVNVPAQITTQPQNQTVTVGAMATFSVVATGTAPLSYQWSKNGSAISGAVGSSYTTPATVSTDNGATFTVKVSNVAGSQTSNAATLTVNATGGVTVALSPRRAGVTTGVGLTFTATVTGSANTAVTWSVDGVAGGSSTVGMISTGGVYSPPSTAGTHTVTATSVANTSASANSTVVVTDLSAVATQRYDNARDGQNLQEYALTSTLLSTAGAFGKVFTCAISDGPVYAQPLYVANLAISGGTHNVVFVATQQNTVYAFDADASPCTTYWKVNLDPAGSAPTPNSGNQDDGDINGPYGIFGTPVIDLAGGVLYAVASTFDGGSTFNYRLHALNLTTGAEESSSPVVISATVSGIAFDPSVHMQRPALLLSGNTVYVSFGSYGDANTYYGWVIGYDKTALTQVGAFNTAPNSPESTGAAIWMAGAGPAADSSGNIYFSSANGPFNVTGLPPLAPNDNFGDTLVKLTSSLDVADFFTPADQLSLDQSDLDLGSAGVVLLADAAGSADRPHLAIAADKESILYLVDRDKMGQYNGVTNTSLQAVTVNNTGGGITTGFFTTASYWNGNVYAGAVGDNVKVYPISNAVLASSPAAQSTESYGYPGVNVVVSAAGASATAAIAWALDTNANGIRHPAGPAILRAYDATSLGKALWSSSSLSTDTCGNAVKFVVPTVANGKVYVVGTNQLTVYGLLP